MVTIEGQQFVPDFWTFFHQFLSNCSTISSAMRETQMTRNGTYSLALIFNNFAIAKVSLFRNHPWIRAWLEAVDRNGGIYRHRWGDVPIHTLALTQFIKREQIARFRYFGYFHRQEYVCASGTENDTCKEQVKPFLTNPSTKYLNYDDGCYPSSENPLCHYYSEIKSVFLLE